MQYRTAVMNLDVLTVSGIVAVIIITVFLLSSVEKSDR